MPISSPRPVPLSMGLLVAVAAVSLGGCVEGLPDAQVGKGDVRNAIAKGTLTSPRNATVALTSLDGAPDAVASRFAEAFRKEAIDREITIGAAGNARYLVRGYLSAYPSDRGTDVAYVYDVFDAQQRRVKRVTDTLTLPGSNADAWALVDDRAMASLAGRCADDLAVALAGMPEAQATRGTMTAAAAPAPDRPVN